MGLLPVVPFNPVPIFESRPAGGLPAPARDFLECPRSSGLNPRCGCRTPSREVAEARARAVGQLFRPPLISMHGVPSRRDRFSLSRPAGTFQSRRDNLSHRSLQWHQRVVVVCWGSLLSLSEFADPGFCNSLRYLDFRLNPLSRRDLGQSSWCLSFPVVPHCGIVEPGQNRDRFTHQSASRQMDFRPTECYRRGGCGLRPARGRAAAKTLRHRCGHRARYKATSREIDRLVAEAHARLPRHLAKVVAQFTSGSAPGCRTALRIKCERF